MPWMYIYKIKNKNSTPVFASEGRFLLFVKEPHFNPMSLLFPAGWVLVRILRAPKLRRITMRSLTPVKLARLAGALLS